MPRKRTCKNDLVFSALDRYRPSERLAAIYDDDEELRTALLDAIPGFEYPNYSWMTVTQVKNHLTAAA